MLGIFESISMVDLVHENEVKKQKKLLLLIMGHLMKATSDIIWKTEFNLSKAIHIHFSGIHLCHKTNLPVM